MPGALISAAEAAQASGELEWIPMGRAGSSQQVAAATVFLASPLSSYISGQTLVVDGGARLSGRFELLSGAAKS